MSGLPQAIAAAVTLLLTLVGSTRSQQPEEPTAPYLDRTEYVIVDTASYSSFRLHVMNPSDSIVVIEKLTPSCGCILATVQQSIATRQKPAEIYIAVTNSRVDSLQPVTVDVETNRNRDRPLRLTIHR